MKCDECIRVGIKSDGVLKTDPRFQLGVYTIAIIPLLAGDLARSATDALRRVDQGCFDGDGRRLCHALLPATLRPEAADLTLTTFTRQALVS
jgi:hypothetical protein